MFYSNYSITTSSSMFETARQRTYRLFTFKLTLPISTHLMSSLKNKLTSKILLTHVSRTWAKIGQQHFLGPQYV